VNVDYLVPLFGRDSPILWLRLVEYVPLYLWLVGYWWWTRRRLWQGEPLGASAAPAATHRENDI
jgi:hypothetical protein